MEFKLDEKTVASMEHEEVATHVDAESGYRGIIAIHNTRLGMAIGGTRYWTYANDDAAMLDALRLSRGMTYKCAMAGLPLGGGKAVLIKQGEPKSREEFFRIHGRFVNRFGGRFLTAEDVGTTPDDMDIVRGETRYVAGLTSASGDPSPWTARGVARAIMAAAKKVWGPISLAGKVVAIQGCGNTGRYLAYELRALGADIIVSDIDADKANQLSKVVHGVVVSPEAICDQEADIFSPCALGGVLGKETIGRLRCSIVAGTANNPLGNDSDADTLHERDILYVPDYVINAGGVINGCREMLGWTPAHSSERIDAIYDVAEKIIQDAAHSGRTPLAVANETVRNILNGTS